MKIRVQGTSKSEIIEAGKALGIFLKPSQGRGNNIWFGYGFLDLNKMAVQIAEKVIQDHPVEFSGGININANIQN